MLGTFPPPKQTWFLSVSGTRSWLPERKIKFRKLPGQNQILNSFCTNIYWISIGRFPQEWKPYQDRNTCRDTSIEYHEHVYEHTCNSKNNPWVHLGANQNLHLVVVVEAGLELQVGHQLSVVVVGNVHHPVPEDFRCFSSSSHYRLCLKTHFHFSQKIYILLLLTTYDTNIWYPKLIIIIVKTE